jgi:hypothetical protein
MCSTCMFHRSLGTHHAKVFQGQLRGSSSLASDKGGRWVHTVCEQEGHRVGAALLLSSGCLHGETGRAQVITGMLSVSEAASEEASLQPCDMTPTATIPAVTACMWLHLWLPTAPNINCCGCSGSTTCLDGPSFTCQRCHLHPCAHG